MMALANGIVLAVGALLISVPIILHLLMQPKPRRIIFPALRFVRQRQQSNRRQLQMRHWLLLMLRCLLIAAAVLALAGVSAASAAFNSWSIVGAAIFIALLASTLLIATFWWTQPVNKGLVVLFGLLLAVSLIVATAIGFQTLRNPTHQVLGNRIAPVSTVILVDTSPRMQFIFENQSRLDKAREMCQWLLEQFPKDSQVSIAAPDGSEPFFSVDLSAAEKRLETLATDFAAAPLPRAIGAALKLLSESAHERREIYIVTDMTARSWRETSSLKSAIEEYPNVTIYLIDIGVERPRNAAIGSIRFSSEVISQTSTLEINSDIRFQGEATGGVATLAIELPDPSRPVRADGKTLVPDQYITRQQIVDASAESRTPLRFVIDDRLPPGTHHGWIEFQSGDGLSLDDRRYFTISMRKAWQVLVVVPRDVVPDNLIEILSPYSFREAGTQEFDCTVIEQAQMNRLSEQDIKQFQAVYLLDPKPLTDGNWNLLANFAEQGGGVAVFLGRNAAQDGMIASSFTSASARRVLPGVPTEIFRAPTSDTDSVFLVRNSSTHPMANPFVQSAFTVRWDKLPIHQHWGMRVDDEQDTAAIDVIFRFSNQRPAVVEWSVGAGRVVLVLTPITEPNLDSRWNDLFYDLELCWPAFLLVKEMANYLVAAGTVRLNLTLGEHAVLDNDRATYPEEYRVFTPRDEEPLRISANQGQVIYRFADLPGHYRLKGAMEEVVLRGFSFNIEDGETDLTRIDRQQLDDWFGENRIQLARDQNEIEREQGVMRMGREFYPIFVSLMAVLLALELVMSNRFYQQSTGGISESRNSI